MRKLTTEIWVQRAKEVHNDKYDYSNSVYTNKRTKISIKCNTCNTIFNQWPTDHINGCGCSKCAWSVGNVKYTTSVFIKKAKEMFKDKYDYSNTMFISISDKVSITCNKCKESYYQKASSHMQGHETCQCYVTAAGFRADKPAILYYLSINKGELFKIGITNRSVKERFLPYELKIIDIVHITEFNSGKEALAAEKQILEKYVKYKYTGPNVLNSGNTELFTIDVLNLYKKDQL